MRIKVAGLFMLGLLLLTIVGCGKKEETVSDQSESDVLTISDFYEPSSLDPGIWYTMEEGTVGINFFEGLLRVSEDGGYEPGMASEWEISNDQLTYTFHIREDAKWSDGKPVTARDFEFSWRRVLNPETNSPTAYMMYPIKNAEAYNTGKATKEDVGIKALGDTTFQVTLEKPTPHFLGLIASFTFAPVREDVIQKAPVTWSTKAQLLVSNGPFHVTKWMHKYRIEAEANEHYWDEKNVKISKLILRYDGTVIGKWADFEDGLTDITYAIPDTIDLQKELQDGRVYSQPTLGTQFFQFNTTRKPFDNPRVRKALGLVIDKQRIVEIRGFGEEAAGGLIPPGIPDHSQDSDFRQVAGEIQPTERTESDIEEAKRLLAEEGYPNGKGFPVINYLGESYLIPVLEEGFSKLGISIKTPDLPVSEFNKRLDSFEYDLSTANWFADFNDPINFLFLPEESEVLSIDSTFDDAIARSYTEMDAVKRFEALHEAEKALMESYAMIPYAYNKENFAKQDRVKGFVRTARTEPLYRLVKLK